MLKALGLRLHQVLKRKEYLLAPLQLVDGYKLTARLIHQNIGG